MEVNQNTQENVATETKFCKECGAKIAKKAVVCPQCGCQVEEVASANAQPQIVINNSNQNQQNMTAANAGRERNKWVYLVLCFFLGGIGAHKFYEGKIGMGIIYLFTGGLLGIGVIIDFITHLFYPTVYNV